MTPSLVSSPAMEPFLDSFFIENESAKKFLPTSPEFSLKKIFPYFADNDGIFEIAHAFRDESISNLHLPEFTMWEWYQKNTMYERLDEFLREFIYLLFQYFAVNHSIPAFEKKTLRGYIYEKTEITISPEMRAADYKTLCDSLGIQLRLNRKQMSDEIFERYAGIQYFTMFMENHIQKFLNHEKKFLCIIEFPEFVRGMAKLSKSGWAQRMELYYSGIEIANGYQELDDREEILKEWNLNNEIRKENGKSSNPVDEKLVSVSSAMKEVSGMALGVERLLMSLFNFQDISVFRSEY